jgi:heme/copper-type cytochrome/quinol oxidase subunit 2
MITERTQSKEPTGSTPAVTKAATMKRNTWRAKQDYVEHLMMMMMMIIIIIIIIIIFIY